MSQVAASPAERSAAQLVPAPPHRRRSFLLVGDGYKPGHGQLLGNGVRVLYNAKRAEPLLGLARRKGDQDGAPTVDRDLLIGAGPGASARLGRPVSGGVPAVATAAECAAHPLCAVTSSCGCTVSSTFLGNSGVDGPPGAGAWDLKVIVEAATDPGRRPVTEAGSGGSA